METVVDLQSLKIVWRDEDRYIIPTFDDIMQCTDKELSNIATYASLCNGLQTGKQFIALAERLIPERFKLE